VLAILCRWFLRWRFSRDP